MIDLLASLVGNGSGFGYYDPHFAFYNAEWVLIPLLMWAVVSWGLMFWGVIGQWRILARVGLSVGFGINISFFSTWLGLLGTNWADPLNVIVVFGALSLLFIPVIYFLTGTPERAETPDRNGGPPE